MKAQSLPRTPVRELARVLVDELRAQPAPKWLDLSAGARYTSLCREVLRRAAQDGRLRVVRIGKAIRTQTLWLDQFMLRYETEAGRAAHSRTPKNETDRRQEDHATAR